ncbi:hypothetical protein [Gaiella sp.]|uniref:hypothetical protein n=1 Tax=Gaiella sp. TaxID=2663207 RepID=UPI002E32DBB3|nr:hypothetical protein [Gaiella sp.]HEX5582485.1 hypothetical protein [Gaiella sp.]
MGLAVPSVVEASRGLPSVKPAALVVDDDLVAFVAAVLPVAEPVSPELALVDPVLAARLRALLPEIELQIGLEPDPPPRALRVLPDLGPDNVLVLPLPPELAEGPSVAPAPPVAPVAAPPLFPSRADRWRALAKSFAAGAAVATFVTVGVVAKLGEGPAEQPPDPGPVPPRAAPAAAEAAAGGHKTGAAPHRAPITKPQTSPKKPAASRRAEKRAAAQQRAQAKAPAAKQPVAPKQSSAPKHPATASQNPKSKPASSPEHARTGKYPTAKKPAAPPPRRFAWAPVDGAVGYRVELFRGTKQVLEQRTKDPVFELVSPWSHSGRSEKLSSGSYRWYVWPVFSNGPAAQAVVQAQLRVP